MYYGVDENGNIIMSETSDVIGDEIYEEFFPFYAPGSVSDGDMIVLDGDLSISDGDMISIPTYPIIDYDYLVDALANVPSYNVFPNTSAVNVFDGVFLGLPSKVDYVVLSGSDSSSAYMYYTLSGSSSSGNTVVLNDPVYQLSYYTQRVNNVTSYYYTVNQLGESSFTFGSQLVYTNVLQNYPNLPSDSREFGHTMPLSSIFSLVGIFFGVGILIASIRKRGGKVA